MNITDQQRACAELDGFEQSYLHPRQPDYFTYNAIIPCAQKHGVEVSITPTTTPADVVKLVLTKTGKWR